MMMSRQMKMEWKESSLFFVIFNRFVIENLPKLVCLPEGLQHVTTLQRIHISYCHGLVALPEWMSNLTSLKGEDWPNIAHIDRKSVQEGPIPYFFFYLQQFQG